MKKTCAKAIAFDKQLLRKIIIMSKLCLLLLTCSVLTLQAGPTYAQQVKINLEMKNASLSDIISAIKQQTEFEFAYDSDLESVKLENVSINAQNEKIDNVLASILQGTDINYKVIDKIILLSKNTLKITSTLENRLDIQQLKITGTVTDEKGNPLPGVTVLVKGTTAGTLTDATGKYVIDNPPQNATLIFSFIGMTTQEIPSNSRMLIDVMLKEKAIGLDEVVVIGYGTQRKVSLTGSVASVNNKEIAMAPVTNISNSITGLLPGVITKNNTGEPGNDNAVIFIRGRSTTGDSNPLIVVDGIQDVTGWQRINPNDIESISVLKDASAAIYGARAANGVILITTKRGALGKPTLSYSFNQGIAQPTKWPKMADSPTFATYVNNMLEREGQPARYTDTEIQKFRNGSDPKNYPNVDWYKAVLSKTTLQSQHNLSLRGGTEAVKYSFSGTSSNEDGIYKSGALNYKTYSLRSNIDASINKYLKVGFDLNSSYQVKNSPKDPGVYGIFGDLRQLPMTPVYWPDSGLPSAGVERGNNPAVEATSAWGNDNIKTEQNLIKASFDLSVPWVKGLGVDGYFSYNKNESQEKLWQKPYEVYDYDKTTGTYTTIIGGDILLPQLTQSLNTVTSTLYNLRIKYEKQINDHHLNAFVATEQEESKASYFSAFRKNYISTTIPELFAGSVVDQVTNGTSSESGRRNLFGRLSYTFKEKYLADLNFRYDGSSNFPKGKQWGFFPGASVAWRISQENFMKNNVSFVDNLKLRASYAQIGNDAIAAFQNLRLYTLNTEGYTYGITQEATQGLLAGVSPNPNITWEVSKTVNIGLDASLWNGLLGFELDLFKQRRSNILLTQSLAIPVYTGLILPNENIGIIENKGFELQLSTSKKIGDISYKAGGNVAFARNNVIYISEASNIPAWQKAEGHVLGSQQTVPGTNLNLYDNGGGGTTEVDLYYHCIGIFRTQAEVDASPVWPGTKVGDLKYEDINKDGVISGADRIRTNKTNIPEVTFGFNTSVSYKNFSLWANFTGATTVWQYYKFEGKLAQNNLQYIIENSYTPGSMTSKYPWLPTVATESEPSGLHSDFWLMDASYVRLKTLELSYSLPDKLLSKVKISSMRIYVNGNNLFTLTKEPWIDPENTALGAAFYPQSRIFNLGINVSF